MAVPLAAIGNLVYQSHLHGLEEGIMSHLALLHTALWLESLACYHVPTDLETLASHALCFAHDTQKFNLQSPL